MNEKFDPISADDDAVLDRLLLSAEWPTLPADAIHRLRRAAVEPPRALWMQIRLLWPLVGAVAAVLIIALVMKTRQETSPIAIRPSKPPSQVVVGFSRTATPAEMLRVSAASNRARDAFVRDAANRIAGGETPEAVCATLKSSRIATQIWQEVFRRLETGEESARPLARLTAAAPEARHRQALLNLYRAGRFRDELLPAVAALASPVEVVALARNESDADRRHALATAAITRPSDQVILVALLVDPATHDATIAAVRASASPPTRQLAALLSDPSPNVRRAAAEALGSLCHSGSLPLLERMVLNNNARRDALVAILSCRDDAAHSTLQRLEQDASIRALVRTLRDEMSQTF